MPRIEKERLATLVAEALREEALQIPVPSPESAWARLKLRLEAQHSTRRRWWKLIPAAGVAAALAVTLALVSLTGPSVREPLSLKIPQAPLSSTGTEEKILHDEQTPKEAGSTAGKEGAFPAASAPAHPPTKTAAPLPARNRATLPSSGEPVDWEEARALLPFPLPTPDFVPPSLSFAGLSLRRLDGGRAVVEASYRGEAAHLVLRVANVPWPDQTEPNPAPAARESSAAPLTPEVNVYRWVERGLYLEIETTLPPEEARAVAQSLRWPD